MSVIEAPIEITEPLAEPFSVPEYDEFEKAALDYINKVRALFKFPSLEALPKGQHGDPYSCVVAEGIRIGTNLVVVQGTRLTEIKRKRRFLPDRMTRFSIPYEVAEFIGRFDAGYYPLHQRRS